MSELKPCPLCGGEEINIRAVSFANGSVQMWIECASCPAHTERTNDLDTAIEAWNTRAERTCRMTDRGECSECGAYIVRAWTEVHDFNGDMKRIDLRSHNYCPNCGAKVVS